MRESPPLRPVSDRNRSRQWQNRIHPDRALEAVHGADLGIPIPRPVACKTVSGRSDTKVPSTADPKPNGDSRKDAKEASAGRIPSSEIVVLLQAVKLLRELIMHENELLRIVDNTARRIHRKPSAAG